MVGKVSKKFFRSLNVTEKNAFFMHRLLRTVLISMVFYCIGNGPEFIPNKFFLCRISTVSF